MPASVISEDDGFLQPRESEPASEECGSKQWYAAYTCGRHEKQVSTQLGERRIDHFLPLYRSVRRWKDRRKELQLPLFPGYVFVQMDLRERIRILQIPGVVNFVSFGGRPTPLDEREIKSLQSGLAGGLAAEPHPYLRAGRRVLVKSGPLAGATGIVVRKKEKFRVVLSIELIQRSVSVELDASDLEWIPQPYPSIVG